MTSRLFVARWKNLFLPKPLYAYFIGGKVVVSQLGATVLITLLTRIGTAIAFSI